MAFKRKLRRRLRKRVRRVIKRSRLGGRNMLVMRGATSTSPVFINTNTTAGTLAFAGGAWLVTTPAATGINEFQMGMGFCLSDITNDASYAAIYQLYKILKVKVIITPFYNNYQDNLNQHNSCGIILHSATDQNDVNTATSAQLQRYKDYRVHNIQGMKTWSRTIYRPKQIEGELTSAGTFIGQQINTGWLSTGNIDVEHCGLKLVFETYGGIASALIIPFKIELQYSIAFKDPQ